MRTLLPLLLVSSTALAAPAPWVPRGPAERATISGGPWTLSQGAGAYPSPNPGVAPFAPYYHAFVFGDDAQYVGYFDYRPKDRGEAIVAATSTDQGRSWTFRSQALTYSPPADSPNDDGFGHPFVLSVAGHVYLYTLDRSMGNVDAAGLVVNEIAGDDQDPLAAVAATTDASSAVRTVGLTDPDGIIDVVSSSNGVVQILYLAKDIARRPNVTTVHLAESSDGIVWRNDRAVSGLTTDARPFIGPRGTVVQYTDGSWGLFFSAGLAGEDADALHFIGYAESDDLEHWTVIAGEEQPILSTDASKDPTGGQPWYAGRVYAPSVVPSDDGCSATMMFAGYKTLKVKAAPDDYRQIGRVTLDLCGKADAPQKTAVRNRALAGAPPSSGCALASGDASTNVWPVLFLVAGVWLSRRRAVR